MTIAYSTEETYPKTSEADRPLLRHIPERQRSGVMNTFLRAVRQGETTPAAVVQAVLDQLRAHLHDSLRAQVVSDTQGLQHLVLTVQSHPGEALQLAQQALDWEALPSAERAEIKALRADGYRTRYLETQPATPKQVAFLRRLGHTGAVASKADAGRLIDALKGGACPG